MATLVKSANGNSVGPGSKFYVVLGLYKTEDTGSGYKLYLNRYVHVDGGTNGFRGTNVTTSWGTVALYNTGNYGSSNSGTVTVAYGSTYNSGTLYAQYTGGSGRTYKSTASLSYTVPKPTYTISYNATGGTGAPSNQTKTYGTNLTLSSTVPTKAGYKFKGWATSETGEAVYYPNGTYSTNASITLYAVWQVATLIQMSFPWTYDYYISNDNFGKAFLTDIAIPFTLIVDSDNSSSDFYYDVYYSYNNAEKQSSDGVIKVPSSSLTGTMFLRGKDIKDYIKSNDNITFINIVVKTYTSEISEDTMSTYSMSIPITYYIKSSIKVIQSYRDSDDTLNLRVVINYPGSYDSSKCIPDIYFKDALLEATPSSTSAIVDIKTPGENLREYNYKFNLDQVFGRGTITVKYDDGLFNTSASGIITGSISEQTIYINKNGSIQGFEFIEQDNSDVYFYRNGSVQSSEFIEKDDPLFGIGSSGQVITFELIEN